MQIDFKGAVTDVLPIVLPFVVDSHNVEIKINTSAASIRAAKVMEDFHNKRIISPRERAPKAVARDVIRDLADYLFDELEHDRLKSNYTFTLKQILEL